jgi:acetyl esterase/lipase
MLVMSGWLFSLGLLSFIFTLMALYPARRLGFFMPFYFFSSLLQGELAPWHLLLQIPLALWMATSGGFEGVYGQLGLVFYILSWLGLVLVMIRAKGSEKTLEDALVEGLGENYLVTIDSARQRLVNAPLKLSHWLMPFKFSREGVKCQRNIAYGDAGKRNLLDVYYPDGETDNLRPVLIQIHGGAWIIGHKQQQAMPLIHHLVSRGWVCVSINYRLSPKEKFPAHIIDVKKAIAWTKKNIAQYGGDASFVCLTGGSAGGHLSSLAAVTANAAEFQPGFENSDTTVQAAVPFYGVYDWVDKDGWRLGTDMQDMLIKYVMPENTQKGDAVWEQSSPLYQAGSHDNIPPMYLIHGDNDCLAWVEDARLMTAKLQQVSGQAVAYAELHGAQHAFEIFHSLRTDITTRSIIKFLEWTYAKHLANNK